MKPPQQTNGGVRLPELLAPAGNWDALRAAVANGADAVYFGVEAFNARLRAANFQRQQLPELMHWLHQRGVKGFLTVNVLIFPDELEDAAQLVLEASAAGVDALIVQDIGLARLARSLAPQLAIHGSTQMSITSAAGVAQAAALGCERVVLARELTLRDLTRIQGQLDQRRLAMPLEMFVHGALCVAYSGQCLTSEALGQRSANRGECAQACRLPYQLIVDGQERDLGDQRYLLSPQDLAAWELLPQLVEIGIASLKIEGRLKDASYVAAVTDAYRRSLDQTKAAAVRQSHRQIHGQGKDQDQDQDQDQTDLAAEAVDAALSPPGSDQPVAEACANLELSFSRGLGQGWLQGVNHRQLVHGRWSKKRGPLIGQLEKIEPSGWWLLRCSRQLRPGHGLVFEAPSPDPLLPPEEIGGRVMAVERRRPGLLALRLGPGRLDARRLRPGAPCWLSSDPLLERQWQRQANGPTPPVAQPLTLAVRGGLNQPLELILIAVAERALALPLVLRSQLPLAAATGSGLDRQRLEAQLGRLGGSGWRLASLQLDLPDNLFLPVAELNRLRRQLVEELAELIPSAPASTHNSASAPAPASASAAPSNWEPSHLSSLQIAAITTAGQPDGYPASGPAKASASGPASPLNPPGAEPALHVLVRSLQQLEALQGLPLRSVIAELEQPRELREAVAMGRGCWPDGLWLAGARITRPDEAWSLEPLLRAEPSGFLVRNADQLERLTPAAPCIGDFALNVANPLTAAWFLDHWGLQRITASYDLALPQLLQLVAGCPSGSVEVTVHQHMPLFHMEHCLFCAFLSDGHDHTDCGRPCEQHQVLLRDRSGAEHPLRADLGCRNTLFNARAQTAAEALPQLRKAGVSHLRLELLNETAEQARLRVEQYLAALAGRLSGRELWRSEQLDSRLGVTRGSLKASR
jgi:putative protease